MNKQYYAAIKYLWNTDDIENVYNMIFVEKNKIHISVISATEKCIERNTL